MKKTLAILSALVLVFSLAACGKDEPAETTVTEDTTVELTTEELTEETTLADGTEAVQKN